MRLSRTSTSGASIYGNSRIKQYYLSKGKWFIVNEVLKSWKHKGPIRHRRLRLLWKQVTAKTIKDFRKMLCLRQQELCYFEIIYVGKSPNWHWRFSFDNCIRDRTVSMQEGEGGAEGFCSGHKIFGACVYGAWNIFENFWWASKDFLVCFFF